MHALGGDCDSDCGNGGKGGGGFGVFGNNDDYGTGVSVTAGMGGIGVSVTAGMGGIGVYGSGDVYGVFASSTDGTALHVDGVTTFSRSGIATVAKGSTSVTVKLTPFSSVSLVFATPQGTGEAGVYVQGISKSNDKFIIELSEAPTAALKLGWFVIG